MKYHVEFDIDLKRNPYKGLYIAVEGIDGSGKTTQVEKIAEYFEEKGRAVVRTREPRNDGLIGSIVRQILQAKIKVPSVALQYMFSADRAMHHEEIVIPALKKESVVVSDRCFWSAIPYGILDRIMDTAEGKYDFKTSDFILISQSILSMYHQFIVPDITFYLKVSVETALKRISILGKTGEIYEKKEKLEKIILGYNWLVEKFPKEITIIDAEKGVREVTEGIVERIKKQELGIKENILHNS